MDSSIDWSLSIVPRLQSGYTECGIWAQLSESSAQRSSNNQTSTTEETVLLYSCPKTASPKSVCHSVEIIPNSYPNRNLVKRHLIFSFRSRTIPIPPPPCRYNPCPGFICHYSSANSFIHLFAYQVLSPYMTWLAVDNDKIMKEQMDQWGSIMVIFFFFI